MQTTPVFGMTIPSGDADAFDEMAFVNALIDLDTKAAAASRRVDVRAYGAVGDGVTDDSAAVHVADAAAAAIGGELYFPTPPGGSYAVQALNLASKTIRGTGEGCVLKLVNGAANPQIVASLTTTGVTVTDLAFDCGSQANTIGVDVNGAATVTFGRCIFLNTTLGSIYSNGPTSMVMVLACRFTFATGILFNNNAVVSDVLVYGCRFDGNGITLGNGINFNTIAGSATRIVLAMNDISGYANTGNGGFGICLAGPTTSVVITDATILGNVVYNCANDGIHCEQGVNEVSIGVNTVDNCAGCGINLVTSGGAGSAQMTAMTVSGNTVTSCCTVRGSGGIQLSMNSAAPGRQITVSGNTVRGCGRAGGTIGGIFCSGVPSALLTGNTCCNTIGATAVGILVGASTTVIGNRCFDDQAVKTQQYGLQIGGSSAASLTVASNDFAGNLTGEISYNTATNFLSSSSIVSGAGSPAGVVPAAVGALYRRTDGGLSTSLYVKESGTGTAGWQQIGFVQPANITTGGGGASTLNPDVAAAREWGYVVNVAGATTLTINNPLNPPSATQHAELVIKLRNSGASGATTLTWGTAYAFGTLAKPTSVNFGTNTMLVFEWDADAGNWRCVAIS